MLESLHVSSLLLGFVEVIHVQLSDERAEVVVLKVLRENRLRKICLVPNLKAITRLVPADRCGVLWVVHYFVKLDQK